MNTYLVTYTSPDLVIVSAVTADNVERCIEIFNEDAEEELLSSDVLNQRNDYVWHHDNSNIVEVDNEMESIATTRLEMD